ncbi:MAG: hypothetical protein WCB02_23965 [Bradyrhizobium sp.]
MVHIKPTRKFPLAPLGMLASELPQPRDGGVIDLSPGHDRIVRGGRMSPFATFLFYMQQTLL